MAKTKIPEDIQEKVNSIIDAFNTKEYKKKPNVKYYALFKGDFLYLNRMEGERDSPIARLKFHGKMNNWDFAIYRWSNERYDPDEFLFPGANHLNGTIEGALQAGHEAYPLSWEPSQRNVLDFFKNLLKNR